MTQIPSYDTLIKNVRVVRPNTQEVEHLDLAIQEGRFVHIAGDIPAQEGAEIIDGENLLGFPGLVDAHMHVGIYHELEEDAISESQAAAMGGVTSSINYMRTGQYYLNKTGPYCELFPEVMERSRGHFHVDYAYHLAPMTGQHIREMGQLATEFGVTSFKIFMFYGGHGLHGRSSDQRSFLMIDDDENYDLAHFEFIMRGLKEVADQHPELRDYLSLSLHCETAEIMNAYTRMVEEDGTLTGLAAYSAARPPHSEGLAIFIASYLSHETEYANINLLHLSSRKAMEAALMMQEVFPHINFRREVTVGHLLLDIDAPAGVYAKVNPPIRSREDVEFLWQTVLEGKVDWIVSDHACCSSEQKVDPQESDNIFLAKAGFGGTEYLLSGVFSEGSKRGMSLNQMAELLCWNPSRRYGLLAKGDIAVGYDADLVLLDPDESFQVQTTGSPSSQGYTPFEGVQLTGRVKSTFLRGKLIYQNGEVVGEPQGQYLKRPYG
ncbi:MAG: dihydroorotase family protein, partial [Acidobacteriota bacterium]